MQTNHRSFQPGKFGLPSSPACTRPMRDASFVEGHSRVQSRPIHAPTRPLRPCRPMASESVSVSTFAAHVTPEFTSRSVGPTFVPRSKTFLTRKSSTSATSESSTSSTSFQWRMKGALSQRSSFTSLEDEPEESKKPIDHSLQINSPLFLRPRKDPQHSSNYVSISEGGDSIWDRVALAASTLKVNVNKAWTSTINTSEEEETSPGRDSHLVRVMKAYHLVKASHPSDLPDWLFDERERKPSLSPRFTESPRGPVSDVQPPHTSFRHIYNEVASRAPQHSRTPLHMLSSSDNTGPSKAAGRLKKKAFRGVKRADFRV